MMDHLNATPPHIPNCHQSIKTRMTIEKIPANQSLSELAHINEELLIARIRFWQIFILHPIELPDVNDFSLPARNTRLMRLMSTDCVVYPWGAWRILRCNLVTRRCVDYAGGC
jgi:hypothetical protein